MIGPAGLADSNLGQSFAFYSTMVEITIRVYKATEQRNTLEPHADNFSTSCTRHELFECCAWPLVEFGRQQ